MRKKFKFESVLLFVVFVLFVTGCSDSSAKIINALTLADSKPPVLLEAVSDSVGNVKLVFDEQVNLTDDLLSDFSPSCEGNTVVLHISGVISPGSSFRVNTRVADLYGNTSEVNAVIWGTNPNPAGLKINEFTTKGTDSSPDRVELLVTSSGNLGGFTLYGGTPESYDCMFVFPDTEVKTGDFVVVSWSKEYPADKYTSGIVFASGAESNLSANNGTIVLSESPSQGAKITDAVLYSSFESSKYNGWGTKQAETRANWVINKAQWSGDAVNTSKSTATRSVCRKLDSEDTDTNSNWYVTGTGGSTFGSSNTSPAL